MCHLTPAVGGRQISSVMLLLILRKQRGVLLNPAGDPLGVGVMRVKERLRTWSSLDGTKSRATHDAEPGPCATNSILGQVAHLNAPTVTPGSDGHAGITLVGITITHSRWSSIARAYSPLEQEKSSLALCLRVWDFFFQNKN